jgi:hypothetical protein
MRICRTALGASLTSLEQEQQRNVPKTGNQPVRYALLELTIRIHADVALGVF